MISGKSFSIGLCVIGLAASPGLQAYELATHARLTREAFNRSVLTDNKFLKSIGLDFVVMNPSGGVAPNPFGDSYYDVSGDTANLRQADPNGVQFDVRFMGLSDPEQRFTLPAWLMRGAIREDDAYGEDNPQDDSLNPKLRRPLHHFYDPVFDRPLTVTGIGLLDSDIHTAPAWALGTTNVDAFGQSQVPENNHRNHFTVFDAREAMYRALTGKGRNASGGEFDAAPTKTERDSYWATLFRALGDIVHLMQDMGQPQHTRNDQHAGKFPEFLTGHKSAYEAYTDCRATGGRIEEIDNYQDYYIDACGSLTYTGYPAPVFTKYSDYFATRDGTERGLAEYSNRGFFTAGTNLASNNYPSPPNDRSQYTEESAAGLIPASFRTTVKFLRGNVTDTRTGEANNIRLTTESAFNYFLGTARSYSLNAYNYNDQADLLIPRAVAYSAGLIDYFFRGRIEGEEAHYTDATPDSCGKPACTGIELRVKNAIDPETAPPEWRNEILYARTRLGGASTLRVAYEYQDENGVTKYGISNAVALKTVDGDDDVLPGEVSREIYKFSLALPSGIVRNLQYRLVFRGRLGDEDDAVVAGAFKPVSGFLVRPDYPPQDGIPGARMIYKTATGWKLALDEGLVAGNIDWKGWYDAQGNPTKVLSWKGPQSRYFPEREYWSSDDRLVTDSSFARNIYKDGELFSVAPSDVLGAALTKDSTGRVWLVTICMEGTFDVVYRRPAKKNDSAVLYHPQNAPDGWREIGRFNSQADDAANNALTHTADIPWFFNGDGTAAQTIRRWWLGTERPTDSSFFPHRLKRLEMTIVNDVTEAQKPSDHGNLAGYSGNASCNADYDAYGAGSTISTSQLSGEYVFAVDYKNNQPVLAKIRVQSQSNDEKVTTVLHNHPDDPYDHSRDVISTTTTITGSQTEELVLDSFVVDIHSYNENITHDTLSITSNYKDVTYYMDLRKDLYAYSYTNVTKQGFPLAFTENYLQGNEIISNLAPGPIELSKEIFPPTSGSTTLPPVDCMRVGKTGTWSVGPYYSTNLGWIPPLSGTYAIAGSWAVDVQNNLALTQNYYGGDYYDVLGPANYLSGAPDPKTGLESVIQTAPAGSDYYPIGVLR